MYVAYHRSHRSGSDGRTPRIHPADPTACFPPSVSGPLRRAAAQSPARRQTPSHPPLPGGQPDSAAPRAIAATAAAPGAGTGRAAPRGRNARDDPGAARVRRADRGDSTGPGRRLRRRRPGAPAVRARDTRGTRVFYLNILYRIPGYARARVCVCTCRWRRRRWASRPGTRRPAPGAGPRSGPPRRTVPWPAAAPRGPAGRRWTPPCGCPRRARSCAAAAAAAGVSELGPRHPWPVGDHQPRSRPHTDRGVLAPPHPHAAPAQSRRQAPALRGRRPPRRRRVPHRSLEEEQKV